ncbi:MAG: hypothetical protein GXP27_01500 [Planctomycetes bacterium]|nr:hypothetical protein [Planctomycetota bacterium]
MGWKNLLTAALAVLLISSVLKADDPEEPVSQCRDEETCLDGDPFNADPFNTDPQTLISATVLRFGWWGVSTDGSQSLVGEWQDTTSSPFWDVDRLFSNGTSMYDVYLFGTDNETTEGGLHFYTPLIQGLVHYERFIHRVDHDHWEAWRQDVTQPPYNQDDVFDVTDLDEGVGNAVRIQELNIRLKGNITENLRWRVNIWTTRTDGQREASAVAHCQSTGVTVGGGSRSGCHALSQQQSIDWRIFQIEPVLEAHFEKVSIEYSRPMRSLTQSDELVTRDYNTIGVPFGGFTGADVPYAVVPENFYQLDKVKMSARLGEKTDLYAVLYNGGTRNRSVGFSRYLNGWDIRLTNRSLRKLRLTSYYKRANQKTQRVPADPLGEQSAARLSPQNIFPLWNRELTKVGIKGRWRPFQDDLSFWNSLALLAGYEYRILERDNTEWHDGFAQPDTVSNIVDLRMAMKWTRQFDSYLRYRMGMHSNPLRGVDGVVGPTSGPDEAVRSSLPEQEDLLELGGTWMPSDNFLVMATLGFEKRHASSKGSPLIQSFDEDDYPMTFSFWYSPTEKFSVSGGLGFFSNWIDQDITLGANNDPTWPWYQYTTPWSYGGRAQVVNLGCDYAVNDRLTLIGQIEWTESRNQFERFADPPPPAVVMPTGWSEAPNFSDVRVETTRLAFGFDYVLTEHLSCYFRYNLFDYEDRSANSDGDVDDKSGTAHFILGGLTASY